MTTPIGSTLPTILPTTTQDGGSPVTTTNEVQQTSQSGSSQSGSIWFGIGQPRRFADILGIAMPSTPGNVAAVLANLSILIDEVTAEAEKKKIESAFEMGRSKLVDSILEGLKLAIEAADARITSNNEKLATLKPERDRQQEISDGYGRQIGSYNTHIWNRNNEIDGLTGQINGLNSAINALPSNSSERPGLIRQRDDLVGERAWRIDDRDRSVRERDAVIALKEPVDARIRELNNEISGIEADNSTQQNTMQTQGALYAALQFLTMSVFIQIGLATRNNGQEVGMSMQSGNDLDEKIFDNVAETAEEALIAERALLAINNFTAELDAARGVSGRAVDLALELLGGLADTLMSLALLASMPNVDSSTALERGSRVRVGA